MLHSTTVVNRNGWWSMVVDSGWWRMIDTDIVIPTIATEPWLMVTHWRVTMVSNYDQYCPRAVNTKSFSINDGLLLLISVSKNRLSNNGYTTWQSLVQDDWFIPVGHPFRQGSSLDAMDGRCGPGWGRARPGRWSNESGNLARKILTPWSWRRLEFLGVSDGW